jgi:hypothetical protein
MTNALVPMVTAVASARASMAGAPSVANLVAGDVFARAPKEPSVRSPALFAAVPTGSAAGRGKPISAVTNATTAMAATPAMSLARRVPREGNGRWWRDPVTA